MVILTCQTSFVPWSVFSVSYLFSVTLVWEENSVRPHLSLFSFSVFIFLSLWSVWRVWHCPTTWCVPRNKWLWRCTFCFKESVDQKYSKAKSFLYLVLHFFHCSGTCALFKWQQVAYVSNQHSWSIYRGLSERWNSDGSSPYKKSNLCLLRLPLPAPFLSCLRIFLVLPVVKDHFLCVFVFVFVCHSDQFTSYKHKTIFLHIINSSMSSHSSSHGFVNVYVFIEY